MKKSIKIISLFVLALVVFSCQNPYSVLDESAIQGIYPHIVGTPQSVLFYYNNGTSSYKADMALNGPTKPDHMDAYVVVGTTETLVKTFPLPATTTYEVTLQEIATALNQPLANFAPGASIVLRNKIVGADGKTYDGTTTTNLAGSLLSGTAYQNLFADLTVFVTCPFVADDAVGTYTVVRDDWVDYYPGDQLTVSKIDDSNIIVNEYPGTYGNNHHGMVITVDQASGTATVTKQLSGGYGATDVEYTAGAGFVFSCVGYIKVTLNFTYNGGAYNGYTLIMSK